MAAPKRLPPRQELCQFRIGESVGLAFCGGTMQFFQIVGQDAWFTRIRNPRTGNEFFQGNRSTGYVVSAPQIGAAPEKFKTP